MMPDVVIIEDESVLREVLVEGLSGALPDLSFSEYGSVEEAVEGIENEPPRLIISDVRLPGKSGVDFLIDAHERWPSTQFILMTAFATLVSQEQASAYGALRLLRKPFALKDLTQAVQKALQEDTFVGKFRGISLMDLMQVINLGQKTLAIDVQYGPSHAEIFFRNGEIVHVEADGQDGIEAFNELVGWQGGLLDVRYGKEPSKISIRQPFQHLMLEAVRVLDHAARDQQEGVSPASDDAERGEQSFADIDQEVESSGSVHAASSSTVPQAISKVDLSVLRRLDGFVAAALVDSESGQILSSERLGELDFQLAATGHAELLRMRRRMLATIDHDDEIEDIVISLRHRYHVLRTLEEKSTLFLYAVFDRTKAILGVVRQSMRDLERRLQEEI